MARVTDGEPPREDRPRPATIEDFGVTPGAFDADRMVDEFIVLAEWLRGREESGCARAVGRLADCDAADRRFVRLLRLWLAGPSAQATAWAELSAALGPAPAQRALRAFEHLLEALAAGARGPIWRHAPCCVCLGRDEGVLAGAVAAAARGEFGRAAALVAPLTRPEVRPAVLGAAHRVGVALAGGPCAAPGGGWLH